MTDREYIDILRLRGLSVLDKARACLELHPMNGNGSMSPHAAIEALERAAKEAEALKALAQAARVNP
jgi:hypothetical protein